MGFVVTVKRNYPVKKRNKMNYSSEIKDEVLLLSIEGDLIGDNDEALLIEEITSHITDNILLCAINISAIRFINSSGIGILITILTKFRNKGGEVILVKPSEQVKKLLIITKLNSIFTVVEDEDTAISQLKNNLVK